MSQKRKGDSLEDRALKRICLDVAKHSVQYATEKDNAAYNILLRYNSHEILEIIKEAFCTGANERTPTFSMFHRIFPEEDSKTFRDLLDFFFNKFRRRITLSGADFNEEISSAISRNCKDLQSLALSNVSLSPATCVSLFKGIGNLTVLSLRNSGQLSIKAIEAISTSLIHLKSLDLKSTKVVDFGLYVLCGHKYPYIDCSTSGCCFTQNCRVICPLKLQRLNVSGCVRQEPEIACLMTHIPTLRALEPQWSARFGDNFITSLARTVCKIVTSRAGCGKSGIQFEIENLSIILDDVTEWDVFFRHCKKLKYLEVNVEDRNRPFNPNMAEALASNDLQCLQHFVITLGNPRNVMTDNFRLFWETRGHQLAELHLKQSYKTSFSFSTSVFSDIIILCPNLRVLNVDAFFAAEDEITVRFPMLTNLRNMDMLLRGNGNMAHMFCCEILPLCTNVRFTCFIIIPHAADIKLLHRLQSLAGKSPNMQVKYGNF